MNCNFKVVFSKARGALMVVNEATSSVQAKGTKTVIAAAVAALSLGAGVASAAGVQYDSAEIGSGASLTVTVDGSNTVLTPSGVVGTKSDDTTGTLTKDDTVTGAYTLSGGELIINGTTFGGTVAADTATKKANGTITLNATNKDAVGTGATYTGLEAGTYSTLNLNLNVFNAAATGGTPGSVTIGDDNKNLTLKAGTLTTGTIASSVSGSTNKATAEIKGNTLAFGVPADTVGTNKEPSATNPGSAYDFDNAADVQLKVTAADTVTFNKGTISNAGTMTVSGTNGVTVEKEVSIANTG
ncbi:ESPR-type extended signal peptide-containing protein, partial [Sutterella wadsworthensis]|uniref:ESPR-type extended signal peptide-containing protein n=1 Tax=Sutterella wadsworthensis TaxID=40545 RepID=UPI003966C503